MTWLYLSSLILGGIFVVPMVLGGLDVDVDMPELDTDLELDMDNGGFFGAAGDIVSSLLSFRSIVMFITFFGATGLLIGALTGAGFTTLLTALGLGFSAAALQSAVFRRLSSADTSSQLTSRDLEGIVAQVMLPISDASRGRIRANLDGQPTYFVARPFVSGKEFAVGDEVIVVEVKQGTAAVIDLS